MKKFVLGFVLGAFIFSIYPIYAATQQAINVTYNNIKMSVNGTILMPDVEPFVFMNRTFVPIRFVTEALGKDVKYNEITDTVEITDRVPEIITTNTSMPEPKTEPTIEPTPIPDATPTNEQETLSPEDIQIYNFNGFKCVFTRDIRILLEAKGYELVNATKDYTLQIMRGNEIVLGDISFKVFSSKGYIEYDFFIANILPLVSK